MKSIDGIGIQLPCLHIPEIHLIHTHAGVISNISSTTTKILQQQYGPHSARTMQGLVMVVLITIISTELSAPINMLKYTQVHVKTLMVLFTLVLLKIKPIITYLLE